jgi:hypothetical protein
MRATATSQARRRRFGQVGSDEEQRRTGREGQCVEQPDRLHRLELEQQVPAPADIGAQGRGDVDQADDRRRQRGKRGQAPRESL